MGIALLVLYIAGAIFFGPIFGNVVRDRDIPIARFATAFWPVVAIVGMIESIKGTK